jgi:hypothetical protein
MYEKYNIFASTSQKREHNLQGTIKPTRCELHHKVIIYDDTIYSLTPILEYLYYIVHVEFGRRH